MPEARILLSDARLDDPLKVFYRTGTLLVQNRTVPDTLPVCTVPVRRTVRYD